MMTDKGPAERLAGARVTEAMIEAGHSSVGTVRSLYISKDEIRVILDAALAEPAGEAEPVQVGWAYRDKRWDEDRWHVCGWEKPREHEGREVRPIFIGTSPPDASAIREALELCKEAFRLIEGNGIECIPDTEAQEAVKSVIAALAGAKP